MKKKKAYTVKLIQFLKIILYKFLVSTTGHYGVYTDEISAILERPALKSPVPIPGDFGGEGEGQHLSPTTSPLLWTTEDLDYAFIF